MAYSVRDGEPGLLCENTGDPDAEQQWIPVVARRRRRSPQTPTSFDGVIDLRDYISAKCYYNPVDASPGITIQSGSGLLLLLGPEQEAV